MWTATRIQHVMIDIEPPNIEVTLSGQVQQIRSTISPQSNDQCIILRPVQVCIPLERFLEKRKNIDFLYQTIG